jgi:hypothetical protein
VASHRDRKDTPVPDFLRDLGQSLLPPDSKLLESVPQSMRRSARWLAIGAGTACLLAWNARLVMATGAGVGMLWLAYSLRDIGWRSAIADLVNRLEGLNQKIVLSALSGAGATFGTYLIISIWLETQNHWLATGMILQGTATMGTLGLLLWQNWAKLQHPQRSPTRDWHLCLADLTDDDPLKRLMAIRQINQQIADRPADQAHVMEYFRILLSRETDEVIRTALFDGLQLLSQAHPLKQRASHPQRHQTVLPQAATPEFLVGAENWRRTERVKEPVENFEHN